jgi:hypothetical protein
MQREPAASTRYRLLEPVRHYARNRLLERERLVDVQSRHASFFADFAESVEPHINSAERQRWLHRLEVEHDNLRSALAWAQTSNSRVGRRLAGSLWWFWFHQGCWSEGRTWLRSSLDSRYWRLSREVKGARSQRVGASKSPNKIEHVKPEIAKVLLGAGVLAWTQGDHAVARRCLEDSVSMSRSLRETKLLAYALQFLSSTVLAVGESRRLSLSPRKPSSSFAAITRRIGLASQYPSVRWESLRKLEKTMIRHGHTSMKVC